VKLSGFVAKHDSNTLGYGELMLHGFVDSYWVGDASGKKSTSVFFFSWGVGMITWFNREVENNGT